MGGAGAASDRRFRHLNPDQRIRTDAQGQLSAALCARTHALFINEHKTEMMEAEAWEG